MSGKPTRLSLPFGGGALTVKRRKVLLSWSSGKDSAWSLHTLRRDPSLEVVGLLTTLNEEFDRVAMHAGRAELLRLQAAAAGLPSWPVPLPYPCSNEQYEYSARALEVNYPIFSRGTYMRTGKDRVMADAYNEKISLGEVAVVPGDLICGDGDGIVVIPQERVDEVVAAANEIEDAEDKIREAIKTGKSLLQARTDFNYHALQTRR